MMQLPLIYFVVGTIILAIVFYEIAKRFKKEPLSKVLIGYEQSGNKDRKQEKEKKKKNNSFEMRAKRVNWDVPKTYRQNWFILGAVGGSVGAFLVDSFIVALGGVVIGIAMPNLQLRKKEDAFEEELPLRVEQAINAIEQQITADIPIFEALKQAVPYMQSPIKEEYDKVIEKVERANIPLKKALEDIPERLGLPQLEYFHIILEVAEETEEKTPEIIRDASDMFRRQQKHTNRYNAEVAGSKKEMKMMLGLIIAMVAAFTFMLPDDLEMIDPTLQNILNVIVIGLSVWSTFSYSKKLRAKNLF